MRDGRVANTLSAFIPCHSERGSAPGSWQGPVKLRGGGRQPAGNRRERLLADSEPDSGRGAEGETSVVGRI